MRVNMAWQRWMLMAVGPLALFAIWYVVHDQAWVTQRLLPSPSGLAFGKGSDRRSTAGR